MNKKNSHFIYFVKAVARTMVPRCLTQKLLHGRLLRYERMTEEEQIMVKQRVDYYCKLSAPVAVPNNNIRLGDFTNGKRRDTPCGYIHSIHFYDTYEYSRYFPDDYRIAITSGDVSHILPEPGFCKSRPVTANEDNRNNILLKLNKVRHFMWVKDPYKWEDKECKIIFRGEAATKPRRQRFIEMWKDYPLCDLVPTNAKARAMSIDDHLKYRYIMALEGNDVASNLKWVMSSNSIAVMPRPTCETWFMEGRLKPDYHYIEIKEDYSDLIERIEYYETHPDEAKAIIEHAHEWVRQFQDKETEDLISLMVMEKYFRMTNQIKD